MWAIPPESADALVSAARAIRVISELTAEQRILFRLDSPETEEEPVALALAPTITADPNVVPTMTPPIAPTAQPVAEPLGLGEHRGEVAVGGQNLWAYTGNPGDTINVSVFADNPPGFTDFAEDLAEGRFDAMLVARDSVNEILHYSSNRLQTSTDPYIEALVLPEDGVVELEVRGLELSHGR